jgi:prefoldin alpha subunit
MLVPLTASLYVPGSLDDAEKVLVDVGTGYFIEVTSLVAIVGRTSSAASMCFTLV